MGEKNIKPQDVNCADSVKILGFLNKVGSAKEIAEAIDIPGEKDVDINIARRLLVARGKIGGSFETLEQVARVKNIGPKYFTQIVNGLKGKGEIPIKGVFNNRAVILNIPYSKLETISEIISPVLSKEDRFSVNYFNKQVQIEIVAPDKIKRLVGILTEANINLSDVTVEPALVSEGNNLEGFISRLVASGVSLTSIAFNTGPALILPQNRSGVYATEGREGSIHIENAPVFVPCGDSEATIVATGFASYSEYFAGTPDAKEIQSVVQKTYKKGIEEAHAYIPNDTVQCESPCFPIYSVVFGEVITSVGTPVTGSGSAGGSAGPASGSVDVSGTILGEVSTTIPWSVLVTCVTEGSGEPDGEDNNVQGSATGDSNGSDDDGHTITIGGGTTVTVRCPCGSAFAQEVARVNFSLPYPLSFGVGPPRRSLRQAIDTVVAKATQAAAEALATLNPCGPPCPVEQVTTTIGPIQTITVNNGLPSAWYPYTVVATCNWHVQRKCS